jgi:hypothetical protein
MRVLPVSKKAELGRRQWSSRGYRVMSQKDVEVLRKARDRLVEDRRGLAEALAKPYDRGNTENWRVHLVEMQQTIAAVDEPSKKRDCTVSWLRGRRWTSHAHNRGSPFRSGLSETRVTLRRLGRRVGPSRLGRPCGGAAALNFILCKRFLLRLTGQAAPP